MSESPFVEARSEMAAALRSALARRVVYPLQERVLGRPTFSYLEELEASQWLAREALERLQYEKLAKLLGRALEHCPWHAERIRAAGLEAVLGKRPLGAEDLRRLPLMTKQDARENGEAMRWEDVPGGSFPYNTGGSSGQPLIFRFGRMRQASDAAGRIRARRWWGVDVGDREVYLWGAPVELSKTDRIKTLRDRLINQLVLNAFEMSAAQMDRYIEAIHAFRPKCVYGYASSLALLAAHARRRGRSLAVPGLRVVCTTGEPLLPHQRELITEAFGAPVANEYGSRDIGFTAHETPSGEMLLMSESILLEVLDPAGRPVAPGEVGEAVMTGLCSDAQPFIRYRTGDMIRLSERPASCGRGLHAVAEVAGRSTDFVVRADGTVMHALAVIYVLRAAPGVAEFKLIQHAIDDVEVLVVADARWGADSHAAVIAGLKARLGEGCRIRLRKVEAIAPEASGKYRYVVSHVPVAGGLREAGGAPPAS
ncbi:MAG: phenylacetate--CoA ligase family protein [Rhodocyclaceae bacterium]